MVLMDRKETLGLKDHRVPKVSMDQKGPKAANCEQGNQGRNGTDGVDNTVVSPGKSAVVLLVELDVCNVTIS